MAANAPVIAPSATISSDYLQRMQWRTAFITIVIPTISVFVAVVVALTGGVSLLSLSLLLAMHFLTMLGITVGYHRQFAHRSFNTNIPVRVLLLIMGSMAAQGPVIHWVSNHRRHHEFSDQPGDTHSPYIYENQPTKWSWLRGLWHAHIGWMFTSKVTNPARYAKDLLKDPLIVKVAQWYPAWVFLGLIIPAVIGGILSETWLGALEGFLWGGLVRVFLVHHTTWSINSITHRYGRCQFRTTDHSTNNIWLAIPSAGEAWHNSHHAFPYSARFGLEWWQLDLGYLFIKLLELLGLAEKVRVPTDEKIKKQMIENYKN